MSPLAVVSAPGVGPDPATLLRCRLRLRACPDRPPPPLPVDDDELLLLLLLLEEDEEDDDDDDNARRRASRVPTKPIMTSAGSSMSLSLETLNSLEEQEHDAESS